jgi:hypothetical protein
MDQSVTSSIEPSQETIDLQIVPSLESGPEARKAFFAEVARALQVAAFVLYVAGPALSTTGIWIAKDRGRKDDFTITCNAPQTGVIRISMSEAIRIAKEIRSRAESRRIRAAEMEAAEYSPMVD